MLKALRAACAPPQASSSKITREVMSEALQVVANRLTSGEATNLRISASGASFSITEPDLGQGGSQLADPDLEQGGGPPSQSPYTRT